MRLTDSVFEKDGKQIPFRKAHRTRDAEYVDEDTPLELMIRDTAYVAEPGKPRAEKEAAGIEGKGEGPAPCAAPERAARREIAGMAHRAGETARCAGIPHHVGQSAHRDCGEAAQDSGGVAVDTGDRDCVGREVRGADLPNPERGARLGSIPGSIPKLAGAEPS